MPNRSNKLHKFMVQIPGQQEWCPCDVFFAKTPKLQPPFEILAPSFDEYKVIFTDKDIVIIQAALDMAAPMHWHFRFYLFGNQLWELTKSDQEVSEDELRLLLLETVDRDRKRFERLRQKFSGIAGAKASSGREQIPESVRIFVWRRDEGKCVRCGSNQKLEFDHIIPMSKGGSNTERNIQLLCENCNRSKSDKI